MKDFRDYETTFQLYTATAMFHNALQVAEQYKHLRTEFLKGSFSKYLNDYDTFNGNHMASMENKINQLLDAGKYDEVVTDCKSPNIFDFLQFIVHW